MEYVERRAIVEAALDVRQYGGVDEILKALGEQSEELEEGPDKRFLDAQAGLIADHRGLVEQISSSLVDIVVSYLVHHGPPTD
jgi:hypothetical protein